MYNTFSESPTGTLWANTYNTFGDSVNTETKLLKNGSTLQFAVVADDGRCLIEKCVALGEGDMER